METQKEIKYLTLNRVVKVINVLREQKKVDKTILSKMSGVHRASIYSFVIKKLEVLGIIAETRNKRNAIIEWTEQSESMYQFYLGKIEKINNIKSGDKVYAVKGKKLVELNVVSSSKYSFSILKDGLRWLISRKSLCHESKTNRDLNFRVYLSPSEYLKNKD